MTRYKSTPEDEQLVRDDSADPLERETSIKRLAYDQIYEMEATFARLIKDSSPYVKGAALNALLAYWKKSQYIDDAICVLRQDESPTSREKAAFALSQFLNRNDAAKDYEKRIVSELVRALTHDDDFGVQEVCYQEIVKRLAPDRKVVSHAMYFNRERDVDWELLKPYLDSSQIPEQQLT